MKNKIFILLCFLNLQIFAQTILGVDTLIKSGPINKRINLVIMGDGYTTAQMPQFITNAATVSNYLLNTPPFNNYKKYFNVYAIKCPSPQSGVSHPGTATDVTEPLTPTISVTNNFNTKFDNYNVHRLIYSMNSVAVYSVLADGFPAFDQVVILGNSTEYGGAGGAFAVSSIHPASPEIVTHEIGHSFAGLADEYWAGNSFANEKPNMTANTNPSTVKWSQWMGLNGINIFAYDTTGLASNWYRPHQNCKMRYLNAPFCSVCKQTIIEKIHSLVSPIDGYSPDVFATVNYTSNAMWFKADLVKPNPNTLKRIWKLNGDVIASNVDSVYINETTFIKEVNTLVLTVADTNTFSKDVTHAGLHTYSVIWDIRFITIGIREISPQMEFSMFPNPASELLTLSYTLINNAEVGFSVTDMSGRIMMSEKSGASPAGDYKKEINVSALKEGNYILALRINNKVINNKFIIVK